MTIFKSLEKGQLENSSAYGQAQLQERVTADILAHLAVMNSWL